VCVCVCVCVCARARACVKYFDIYINITIFLNFALQQLIKYFVNELKHYTFITNIYQNS